MVVRMAVYTECRAKRMIPSEIPFTTINSRRVENNLMDHDPLLFPSSPLTSQSSLSSSENSSSASFKANLKLLSPPTIKNQAGCRKQEREKEGGRAGKEEGTQSEIEGREGLTELSQHW